MRLKGVTCGKPGQQAAKSQFLYPTMFLATYGTGAIMAVPGHDTRDWEFAKVFGLPIIEVVSGGNVEEEAFTDCASGTMVNSGFLNGMTC